MQRKTKNKMLTAAVIGTMGIAGYMYMKKNPYIMYNMKDMAKDFAKDAYNKLEDIN